MKHTKMAQDTSTLDMYIQLILDEAMLAHKCRILEENINDALDSNNKTLFLELSAQYANLRFILNK